MENPKSVKQKAQETLKEWRGLAENLHLQMHLGKAEAEKEFDNQRRRMEQWASSTAKRVEDAVEISDEDTARLRASLEELRLQAALARADSEDLLREQQANLRKAIVRVQSDLDEVFKTSKETADGLLEEASFRLQDYQTRFDIFKLQLHLARAESQQEWEKRRKEATVKILEIQSELEKRADEASERWEQFSGEMRRAWQHVRKAFDTGS